MIVWRGATSDADGTKTATGLTSSPVAERSRFVDQQPGRPGYRRWRVWQKAPTGDWCRQNAVPDGLVDWRPVPEDPGIAARSHVELCTSARRFCIQSAVGCVASEDWQAHRWCGPWIPCGRSAVPLRSTTTISVFNQATQANSACWSLRGHCWLPWLLAHWQVRRPNHYTTELLSPPLMMMMMMMTYMLIVCKCRRFSRGNRNYLYKPSWDYCKFLYLKWRRSVLTSQ